MKILYAGDSAAGGAANYLLGILGSMKARVFHLAPSKILKPGHFKRRYDAIILSDFPAKNASTASQKAIADQVSKGSGLLMIGGWGSFSGPSGGWYGSAIEKILPVSCLRRDDRVHLPGGAHILEKKKHSMFRGLSFKNPPVICGLNRVRLKRSAAVLLTASANSSGARRIEYPLLVVDSDASKRVAAFATDLAPHWCGGLVDWGKKRLRLRVKDGIWIEVGDQYVRFVSSLIRWLAGGNGALEGLDRLHEDEKKKGWIPLRNVKDIDNLLK